MNHSMADFFIGSYLLANINPAHLKSGILELVGAIGFAHQPFEAVTIHGMTEAAFGHDNRQCCF